MTFLDTEFFAREMQRFSKSYSFSYHIIQNGGQAVLSCGRSHSNNDLILIRTIYKYSMEPEEVQIMKKLQGFSGSVQLREHFYVKFGVHYIIQENFFSKSLHKFILTNLINENTARIILKQIVHIL